MNKRHSYHSGNTLDFRSVLGIIHKKIYLFLFHHTCLSNMYQTPIMHPVYSRFSAGTENRRKDLMNVFIGLTLYVCTDGEVASYMGLGSEMKVGD